MNELTRHFNHYAPLLGIFIICFLGFWIFSYNRSFQIATAGATCIAYVVWGAVHHHLHKDLHLEVIIEYILFAIIGFLIMASLIGRS